MRRRLLPPELVYGHAGFLRACDGVRLPGAQQLFLYAVDLGRDQQGSVVALAEKTGKPLDQLTLSEFQSVDKTFGRDTLGVFDLQRAMTKRNLTGAPGTKEVAKQLARWREQLS